MTTLNELLEVYQVGEVDDYCNEVNNNQLNGVLNWFYVSDDCGIIAYFSKEKDAFAFRLWKINSLLNG